MFSYWQIMPKYSEKSRTISEAVMIVKEWKKFRCYGDGADYYGMYKSSFIKLAKKPKRFISQEKRCW